MKKNKQFTYNKIIKDLKKCYNSGIKFISYVDFIFSDYTQEIFDKINEMQYSDSDIDSRMIIGVLMFGVESDMHNFYSLEDSTRYYAPFISLTRGKVITEEIIEDFLKNCDRKLLKELFLTTVIEFNDLEFLDLSKMYTYSDLIIPSSNLSIQQTTADNGIILQSLLQYENNDKTALENIIIELKETEDFLENLQKKISKSEENISIKNQLKNSTMLLGSKYCSNENLQTSYLNDFNILSKPNELTREINNKYKKKSYSAEVFEKFKKLTKRHLFRGYNSYSCIFNQKSEFVDCHIAKSKFNKENPNLENKFKEWNYEYTINCPIKCPFKNICTTQSFKQKLTPLKNDMLNKFMNKKTNEMYSDIGDANYLISVQFKKIKKILQYTTYPNEIIENYLFIINTAINIKRKVKIKGSLY